MIELVSVHEPKISMNTVNNQSPKKAVKTWKLAQPYQNGQDTLTYQVSINEVGKDTVMVASNGEYVKMNHVGYSNPGSAFKERKITFGEYAERKGLSAFKEMERNGFTSLVGYNHQWGKEEKTETSGDVISGFCIKASEHTAEDLKKFLKGGLISRFQYGAAMRAMGIDTSKFGEFVEMKVPDEKQCEDFTKGGYTGDAKPIIPQVPLSKLEIPEQPNPSILEHFIEWVKSW